METNLTRDYENYMLLISDMRQKLHRLTYQQEFTDAPFYKYPAIQKEQETISKIIALALMKLDEIISPVKLTDVEPILRSVSTSKNNTDLQ